VPNITADVSARTVARERRSAWRRAVRAFGSLLIIAGLALLTWAFVTWKWEDPFTALVTEYEQRKLASAYDERLARARPVIDRSGRSAADVKAELVRVARQYRSDLRPGDPVGRLRISKLGLNVIVVDGTETDLLRRGPGRHRSTAVPGSGELTYIAGHRTTYGAPFSDIDDLKRGDRVSFELPYGTFEYAVTGRRIVPATFVQALRSRGRDELALQACWPRFFATERIIVYARPLRVRLPGERNAVRL
jgi:sortase A